MQGWLRLKEAARYCGVSKRTLQTWIKDEGLRTTRIRGSILIKREWVDQFLEDHAVDNEKAVDQVVKSVMSELK